MLAQKKIGGLLLSTNASSTCKRKAIRSITLFNTESFSERISQVQELGKVIGETWGEVQRQHPIPRCCWSFTDRKQSGALSLIQTQFSSNKSIPISRLVVLNNMDVVDFLLLGNIQGLSPWFKTQSISDESIPISLLVLLKNTHSVDLLRIGNILGLSLWFKPISFPINLYQFVC